MNREQARRVVVIDKMFRCGISSFGMSDRDGCHNETNILVNLGEIPGLSAGIVSPDKRIYMACCSSCLLKYMEN